MPEGQGKPVTLDFSRFVPLAGQSGASANPIQLDQSKFQPNNGAAPNPSTFAGTLAMMDKIRQLAGVPQAQPGAIAGYQGGQQPPGMPSTQVDMQPSYLATAISNSPSNADPQNPANATPEGLAQMTAEDRQRTQGLLGTVAAMTIPAMGVAGSLARPSYVGASSVPAAGLKAIGTRYGIKALLGVGATGVSALAAHAGWDLYNELKSIFEPDK